MPHTLYIHLYSPLQQIESPLNIISPSEYLLPILPYPHIIMKEDRYLPYSKISSGELYFQNCLKSLCGYTYHLPYKLAYTITATWPYPYNPLVLSLLPRQGLYKS